MPTCLRCHIRRAATCFMRICHACCAGTAATSASATPCTSAASPERAWPYAPSTRSPAGSSIWSSAAYSTMKCQLAASTLVACWWVSHAQQPEAGGGGTADARRQTSLTVLINGADRAAGGGRAAPQELHTPSVAEHCQCRVHHRTNQPSCHDMWHVDVVCQKTCPIVILDNQSASNFAHCCQVACAPGAGCLPAEVSDCMRSCAPSDSLTSQVMLRAQATSAAKLASYAVLVSQGRRVDSSKCMRSIFRAQGAAAAICREAPAATS